MSTSYLLRNKRVVRAGDRLTARWAPPAERRRPPTAELCGIRWQMHRAALAASPLGHIRRRRDCNPLVCLDDKMRMVGLGVLA